MIALLLLVAVFSPSKPTVGDVITVELAPRRGMVIVAPSADYEVVAVNGSRVQLRTFQARPVTVRGTIGRETFSETIPVRSVLAQNDKLQPAPLDPPRLPEPSRLPVWMIAGAAGLAAAIWTLVWFAARRDARTTIEVPAVPPRERFVKAITLLRAQSGAAQRWAALADATRAYLAAVAPHLGSDLTTSEILRRLTETERPLVERILRQGDIEKFAPWPPAPADFDLLATSALTIADWYQPVIPEAEAA